MWFAKSERMLKCSCLFTTLQSPSSSGRLLPWLLG
jgi:hypothetical protein